MRREALDAPTGMAIARLRSAGILAPACAVNTDGDPPALPDDVRYSLILDGAAGRWARTDGAIDGGPVRLTITCGYSFVSLDAVMTTPKNVEITNSKPVITHAGELSQIATNPEAAKTATAEHNTSSRTFWRNGR